MQHCWKNYRSNAWGADELKPVSGRGHNNWGGMGMTLLDSLDTLWVMGMRSEFDDAVSWIKSNLNFNIGRTVSVFETCIRALGGLLSAYDLSGDKVLLEKATDLGNRLLPAFNTQSGIPVGQVNLQSGSSPMLHGHPQHPSSQKLEPCRLSFATFQKLLAITDTPKRQTKYMTQ